MDPLMTTISYWGANFNPRDWLFCDHSLLSIGSFPAVYSLIGTIYGGDARTTFSLPDLRGRVPLGAGYSPGLQNYVQGTRAGHEFVTLSSSEIPSLNQTMSLSGLSANLPISTTTGTVSDMTGANAALAVGSTDVGGDVYSTHMYSPSPTAYKALPITGSVTATGGGNGNSHENRMPYSVVQCIISMNGIYPSRN
ncbi:phage tail protein [Oceanospirillum sediminis]|uniref:Tail fiber protein n=1 Tax=Oceanospirillum sediminis TaxID=2760088 RepID=A0A839IKX9_9GAMM|nr:tail fiber protein [Oceanospirillum sediminis]MBB1485531.1 tail fiber protein [Oceanospirillum sediminis]